MTTRRRWLAAALGSALPTAWSAPLPQRLAAAWDAGGGHRVGVLERRGDALVVAAAVAVPTRAHGLARLPDGSLVAVARRPGDWLLRWVPGQAPRFVWAEPGRSFNGHALVAPDGRRLWTTETDAEGGGSLLVARALHTLEPLAAWPTQGIDAHAMLVSPDGATLWVANGGVPTAPETGRTRRDLARMDASLVALDADRGALRGQWRLADRRLSLRHLAWGADGRIGIALQAEHGDAAERAAAPLLAVFEGGRLEPIDAPAPLAGYGGDIAAAHGGFVVSAPRAGALLRWAPGAAARAEPAPGEVCALAAVHDAAWAAGRDEARAPPLRLALPAGLRIDNHWIAL